MLHETVARWDGLFVGMLREEEVAEFERAIDEGIAYRSYEGAGGFLGLAKVRLRSR